MPRPIPTISMDWWRPAEVCSEVERDLLTGVDKLQTAPLNVHRGDLPSRWEQIGAAATAIALTERATERSELHNRLMTGPTAENTREAEVRRRCDRNGRTCGLGGSRPRLGQATEGIPRPHGNGADHLLSGGKGRKSGGRGGADGGAGLITLGRSLAGRGNRLGRRLTDLTGPSASGQEQEAQTAAERQDGPQMVTSCSQQGLGSGQDWPAVPW